MVTAASEVLVYVNFTDYQHPTHTMAEGLQLFTETSNTTTAGVPIGGDQTDTKFYLNGVSMALVVAMGVVGNLMAMLVLTRRTMRTSTNCFLTALAVWDTVVLIICLPLVSLPELSVTVKQVVFPYIVVYAYPVALSAQTATVWLTVSFTVERYIAVCHPLRAASMCTIPRARMVVISISVVSILYNVPRWFEYQIKHSTDIFNRTSITLESTKFGADTIYTKIYFGWLYFLVMCFIPLCSLAILNAFLIIAVRNSQQQRRDMNVRQSRENNVTIMLVSVVMVFIICQVPALIYNMAYAINMKHVNQDNGWQIVSNYRNFSVTLNSAINFILYCALGQKFRRTFVRTLCPCLVKKMPGRFQSFSFHHNLDTANIKTYHNGNAYAKVIYKQCRTDNNREERDSGLDMKIIRSKYSPQESGGSNCSMDPPEVFDAKMSQHSHKRLIASSGWKPD